MTKQDYLYPIRNFVRRIVFFEVICIGVFALIFYISSFLDIKKEWIKPYLTSENRELGASLLSYFKDGSIAFLHPGYLLLITLLVPLVVIEIRYMYWKNNKIKVLGKPALIAKLLPPISVKTLFWKYFWIRNFILLITLSLAQPIFGTEKVAQKSKNGELIIALDISNSMNVKDLNPTESRLEIAKRAIIQLINTLKGEKIGICVFAGNAYIQLPLTNDYDAAKMYVIEIETDMVSKQGTNISGALITSSTMFSKLKATRAIILVSDGESHTGSISSVIEPLKGIQLAILGIGSTQGGNIPNDPKNSAFGFKTDSQGKKIISKINTAMLASIAQQTNAYASITTQNYPDLEKLKIAIEKFQSTSQETGKVEIDVKNNPYPFTLLLALISLLSYLYISEKNTQNTKDA